MASTNVSFNPKKVVKKLLAVLPDRAQDVLVGRFGLGKSTDRLTLDAIGKKYGITRERVRQIENYGLAMVRKSDAYKTEAKSFAELEELLRSLGGIVVEDDFLGHTSKDKSLQNHIHFLLVLGTAFKKREEDDDFRHRWHVDEKLAENVE
ncbi:MAG: hypothetical protein KGJ35_03285, partial [Patescibacteria group bacterium]|nr:hypothetical protein [Patescibacteria group bacterium]